MACSVLVPEAPAAGWGWPEKSQSSGPGCEAGQQAGQAVVGAVLQAAGTVAQCGGSDQPVMEAAWVVHWQRCDAEP